MTQASAEGRSPLSNGRPDWIEAAYEGYAGELHAYVDRGFRGPVLAEDLVHEAFARLVREGAAGRTPTHVRAWLYRVVHNLAVDALRRDHGTVRPKDLGAVIDVEWRDDVDALASVTSTQTLRAALARLSGPGRTALLMAGAGYSGAEIAIALGRTETATRTLMCRSRRTLRAILARDDDEVLDPTCSVA